MRGLVIAAPSSSQGKTTITLGLLRALRDRGLRLGSGKSGPDYIDGGYHETASGVPCITLDAWASGADQLRARAAMADGEIMVVEGAMGLFDGAETADGGARGSTADLAAALGFPVVLVVNAMRMSQSIGALVSGFANWRPDVEIAGVILNTVGSPKHERMLRGALEGVSPVLGVVHRGRDDPATGRQCFAFPTRHLGLVQANEVPEIEDYVRRMAAIVEEQLDVDRIVALARPLAAAPVPRRIPPPAQRIAVAQDIAFGFSYWHMLEDWKAAGAELTFFSPLRDEAPDSEAGFVFLPGGYPELHAGRLASNETFISGLKAAAACDAVIYGECGGYMVLGDGLVDADGARHAMAGLLSLETSFADRKLHLGYLELESTGGPWTGTLMGHEFHYASTQRAEGEPLFAARDSAGTALSPMGLRAGRVMGSFAHVIETGPAL
ncbi:MAG: cobyrinate a,c-diamide synthase [Pseudomonadota bacterium]